jgi:YD repeat-containing protein
MFSRLAGLLISLLVLYPAVTTAQTDRETDGFLGPVHTVVIETAQLVPAQVSWRQAFSGRAQVTEWLESGVTSVQFTSDPSPWQNKVVGFLGKLHTYLQEGIGIFTIAPFQFVVIQNLPLTSWTKPGETMLLAGRVEGMRQVQMPPLGLVWLPKLHYVAMEESMPPTAWAKWTEKSRVLWRTLTYNRQGNCTEVAFYDPAGALRWRWRYTYNSNGHKTERVSTGADAALRWTVYYTYDPWGNMLEKTEFTADQTLARRWRYTYNTKGILDGETNYDITGALLERWRYAYDGQGRRVEESNHTASGALVWKWLYTYDAQGHVAEEGRYDAAGTLLWRGHYTYDANGNRTGEATYRADGSLESQWHYTYDAYDAVGNWTQQTKVRGSTTPGSTGMEPAQVTHRKITYHR